MARDSEQNLHECEFPGCGRSFPKLWRLKEHQCSAHTGERPHVCTHPGCDKAFIRAYHLKRHMVSHLKGEEKPTFSCSHPGCDKTYSLKQNLRKHEKSHTNPLPYKCGRGGCSASFKKHSQLAVHRAKHHGEEGKLHKCSYGGCGLSFSGRKELKRHHKTHAGYICSIDGCSVTCNSWSEMRKHSSTHAKVCAECGRTFTRTRQLRLHSAIHSTSRCVLTCQWEGCGRTYTTLYNLRLHINSFHCREKPHSCTHQGCPATFATKQSCQRHMATEHSTLPKSSRKKAKRKRSLASHLSGYNPSKLHNTSDQKPDCSPEIIEEGITRKEHNQDSAVRSKTISEETGSVDAALRDSDAVTFSRLSKLQLTSMKFLVPVVHRTRI